MSGNSLISALEMLRACVSAGVWTDDFAGFGAARSEPPYQLRCRLRWERGGCGHQLCERTFVDGFNIRIPECRFVMKQDEALHPGPSRQFECGSMVGVSPVASLVAHLFTGILRIENQDIRIAEEFDKGVVCCLAVGPVLGVGGIDDGLAVLFETKAPGASGVVLPDAVYADITDLKRAAPYPCECRTRCRLAWLQTVLEQGASICFDGCLGFAKAVKDNPVAGDEGRGEEGKP